MDHFSHWDAGGAQKAAVASYSRSEDVRLGLAESLPNELQDGYLLHPRMDIRRTREHKYFMGVIG